ncbi:hypothetical protein [Mariprofundus ferrooxydans]|jgi:hypothetical protein|uniref:Uncharacterized protein n=1 Tax=Mariprofundus ferrooxydans PV-1 TaxID=314345 RepID=Q0EX11_9PROT|nr:hypothetical protein [Mariprofundus ferrooxydans]EAU53863.1 hypothetical protein SPV1_12852 [Mariprofundus ferrooxydans PV-1]KON46415.1 hypothetical protein AL013_13430 [Mariprofundus ferrooxydans]
MQQTVYSKDLLVLRDGQALSGKVIKNEFKMRTAFGDVTVKKDNIIHIHFMRPDGTGFPPTDEIRTNTGDDIRGQLIQAQTISFVLAEDNQTERVPKDNINTLLFLGSQD